MKLSAKTLERLTDIVTGNTAVTPYRTGPRLIEFFRDFGESDTYGKGFGSRADYARVKLNKFNGTEKMKGIVLAALDIWDEPDHDAEGVASQFNKTLARDGYRLVTVRGPGWMRGDEYVDGEPYFELRPIVENMVVAESLVGTSHDAILEQVRKANDKIETGDFAGAIASAYTLLEELLKRLLTETGTSYKEGEGDIRQLYKAIRAPLHLDPSESGIAAPLKPILEGFQKLVAGLYEVANKASDRHARKYAPAAHHAKLAVNSALTLCEFLVESHQYQQTRAMKSAASERTSRSELRAT